MSAAPAVPGETEVVGVEWEPRRLRIHVRGTDREERLLVTFENVIAFRVVDERDLLNFWPVCSTSAGWVFAILDGGWLSEESARSGSNISAFFREAREYLVTGLNECVSVICLEDPVIDRQVL